MPGRIRAVPMQTDFVTLFAFGQAASMLGQ
jgi:hypothetical protein